MPSIEVLRSERLPSLTSICRNVSIGVFHGTPAGLFVRLTGSRSPRSRLGHSDATRVVTPGCPHARRLAPGVSAHAFALYAGAKDYLKWHGVERPCRCKGPLERITGLSDSEKTPTALIGG